MPTLKANKTPNIADALKIERPMCTVQRQNPTNITAAFKIRQPMAKVDFIIVHYTKSNQL